MLGWLHPPVVCGGSRLVGGEPERDANGDVGPNCESNAASHSEADGHACAATRSGGRCFAQSGSFPRTLQGGDGGRQSNRISSTTERD